MTEDKWLRLYLTHRRWVERGAWALLLLGSAIANTITTNLDIRRAGLAFEAWEPAVWEFSSAILWLILIPWILRAADTRPLRWGQLRRHLPWHLLFALITSLAHVLGMVALRKLAYATQDAHYDFGDWPLELVYEALKDVRSYALTVSALVGYRFLLLRLQGEARVLDAPEPAVAPPEPTPLPSPAPLPGPAADPPAPVLQAPVHSPRPERFLVRKLRREFLIAASDIAWLQAQANYVGLHVNGHDYLLRSTLADFLAQLDPARFVRVHRSYAVNLDAIAVIEPTDSGDARLVMKDGSTVPCSRRYRDNLAAQGGGS